MNPPNSFLRLLIFLPFLLLLSLQADEGKLSVAKVDYREIEDLVKKVVLNKPENAKIAAKYLAQQKAEQEMQEQVQEAMLNGEGVDMGKITQSFAAQMMSVDRNDEKLATLCDKHLLELIEAQFGERYDLIIKEEFESPLLYTQVAIVDVTDLLKQELLKQLPSKKK